MSLTFFVIFFSSYFYNNYDLDIPYLKSLIGIKSTIEVKNNTSSYTEAELKKILSNNNILNLPNNYKTFIPTHIGHNIQINPHPKENFNVFKKLPDNTEVNIMDFIYNINTFSTLDNKYFFNYMPAYGDKYQLNDEYSHSMHCRLDSIFKLSNQLSIALTNCMNSNEAHSSEGYAGYAELNGHTLNNYVLTKKQKIYSSAGSFGTIDHQNIFEINKEYFGIYLEGCSMGQGVITCSEQIFKVKPGNLPIKVLELERISTEGNLGSIGSSDWGGGEDKLRGVGFTREETNFNITVEGSEGMPYLKVKKTSRTQTYGQEPETSIDIKRYHLN